MATSRDIDRKLDADLELALARTSAEDGLPKSVVVRRALAEYLAKKPSSAYEAGKDLFGRHGSGDGTLSKTRRERYAELIDAKRRRRR